MYVFKTIILILVLSTLTSTLATPPGAPDQAVHLGNSTTSSDTARLLRTAFVTKSGDGSLDDTATQKLAILQNGANRSGSIKVWVSFVMNYEGNPSLRTADVVAAEHAQKQALIELVINPLQEGGNVELLTTPDHLLEAPGCLVSTDEEGLGVLAYSASVKRLSYHR